LLNISGKAMPKDSLNQVGSFTDHTSIPPGDDPVGEMIAVLHSLGIMAARGPTLTFERWSDTAQWLIGGLDVAEALGSGQSPSVSSSERIVEAFASEAP
jgi:hypothetical protein